METSPVTCRTLETFYHINAHTFEKQYKETLSGFRDWDQLGHADSWLLFPENIGPHLAIDEASLSNGELYTFVTNRDRHAGDGSLVAVVSGTKAEDVIRVLKQVDEEERMKVKEVTLDLSDSMRKDCFCRAFPKAQRVIDRFHIQKMACDAVQEIRVAHRWDALQQANDEMERGQTSPQALCAVPFFQWGHAPGIAYQKPLPRGSPKTRLCSFSRFQYYAHNLDSLNKKNGMSATPLN